VENVRIAPEVVLEFWFGNAADDPIEARARNAFWFGAASETDRTIRDRFTAAIKAAGRGEFADWLDHARSALALVVMLDQFPLNVWRGTAKAYTYSAQALHVTRLRRVIWLRLHPLKALS
jgi:uncharacterized protein (DUF924 family)